MAAAKFARPPCHQPEGRGPEQAPIRLDQFPEDTEVSSRRPDTRPEGDRRSGKMQVARSGEARSLMRDLVQGSDSACAERWPPLEAGSLTAPPSEDRRTAGTRAMMAGRSGASTTGERERPPTPRGIDRAALDPRAHIQSHDLIYRSDLTYARARVARRSRCPSLPEGSGGVPPSDSPPPKRGAERAEARLPAPESADREGEMPPKAPTPTGHEDPI